MPLVAWARDAESLEQIPSFHGVPAIREPTHSHAVGEEGPTPPSQTALCPGQPYALVTLYAVTYSTVLAVTRDKNQTGQLCVAQSWHEHLF